MALSKANFQALLMLKWSHIMAIMLSMMKPMIIMSNFLLLMIPNTIAWVLQRINFEQMAVINSKTDGRVVAEIIYIFEREII